MANPVPQCLYTLRLIILRPIQSPSTLVCIRLMALYWVASIGWPLLGGLYWVASIGWPLLGGLYWVASIGWPLLGGLYWVASIWWPLLGGLSYLSSTLNNLYTYNDLPFCDQSVPPSTRPISFTSSRSWWGPKVIVGPVPFFSIR